MMKLNEVLSLYSDDLLKKIYNEEYIPWSKRGSLEDGELRNLMNKYEKVHGANTLLIVEREFIAECAKRFINS